MLSSELQSIVVGQCEGSWFIKAVNVVLRLAGNISFTAGPRTAFVQPRFMLELQNLVVRHCEDEVVTDVLRVQCSDHIW